MINKYLKLGIMKNDIKNVTKDLENILNVKFEEHESSYWGEYNVANISEKEKVKITYNYVDEDWQEEEFKEYPLLLELNRMRDPEKMMGKLCESLDYITPLYLKVVEARVYTKKYYFINGRFELVDEY